MKMVYRQTIVLIFILFIESTDEEKYNINITKFKMHVILQLYIVA